MRIWLDDIRPAPPGHVHCTTARDACYLISTNKVEFISFDHDLGTPQTGYDVARFIEDAVYNGIIEWPNYSIHSANPVGAKNIRAAMESARRFAR